MKTPNLNNEIEKTLRSYENTTPAEVNPFFYTRLSSQLESPKTVSLRKFAFGSIAATLLLLIVNVIVLNTTENQSEIVNETAYVEDIKSSIGFEEVDYTFTALSYENE